jgi:hypothetical protein
MDCGGLNASKEPLRMKEGATRVKMHADSSRSRATGRDGREIRDRERVVGIRRACIANSRVRNTVIKFCKIGYMYLLSTGIRESRIAQLQAHLQCVRMGFGQNLSVAAHTSILGPMDEVLPL